METEDIRWMRYALHLAERGQGRTADNPAVGCVLVKNNRCVGQGWTAEGGRPHAETQALASAGEQARGATAYVTLEPCAHYGHTPPCVNALITCGIARVVVACDDTDSRVAGKGIARLREAGIPVETGILQAEALAMNAGFFRRIRESLPYISVKIATSADEKITDPRRRWITSEASRQQGHLLRAQHQAIVTGVGTVLSDDPALTCRLPGLEAASPLRVILDRHLRTPTHAALVQSAHEYPSCILTAETLPHPNASLLMRSGVTLYSMPPGFDFAQAMRMLGSKGIHRVLIEGGQGLTTAALTSGIANRLYWFKASHVIGEKGMNALANGESLASIASSAHHAETIRLGWDELTTLDLLP